MKKYIYIVLTVMLIFSLSSCQKTAEDADKLIVAVGIVPEAAFVEQVAGDLVEVITLIPPGNSPANYEPSAAEMQALSDAKIYFTLQMPTEQANILPQVEDYNEDLIIVDLRASVNAVYAPRIVDEASGAIDPHLWLSPKRAIVMVQTIADELSLIDEANRETYQQNANDYITALEALDTDIKDSLNGLDNRSFIMYHAAYGYFALDYDLEMVSIETENKEASATDMQYVVDYALEHDIHTVFYQEEFDDTQAQTIAEEIGGKAEQTAPLSYEYIANLEAFTAVLLDADTK